MRRAWLWVAVTLPGACGGCAPFTQAQMDLAEQARRGVARVAAHDAQRDGVWMELARLQRQRLDEAFDRDVRERAMSEALDAEWIIEARQAYAVGIDAFAKAQAAHERSTARRRETLAAIDSALERLQWLQSIQMRLGFTLEPREDQR